MAITSQPYTPKRVLITSFHAPPNDPQRAAELAQVMKHNVQLGDFDTIYALVDNVEDLRTVLSLGAVPVMRKPASGLSEHLNDRYASQDEDSVAGEGAYLYSDFFEVAEEFASGDIVVVSNSDIEFDSTIRLATVQTIGWRTAWVMARYWRPCGSDTAMGKVASIPESQCYGLLGSFDAFVFRSPLPHAVAHNCNHRQNTYGAENVVAFEMMTNGAINVTNVCKVVTVWHRHCNHRPMSLESDHIKVNRIRSYIPPIVSALPPLQ